MPLNDPTASLFPSSNQDSATDTPSNGLKSAIDAILSSKLSLPEKVYYASKVLNDLGHSTAVPTMLALRLLLYGRPERRSEVMSALSRTTGTLALPQVIAALLNSGDKVMDSSHKLDTLGQVAPSTIAEILHHLAPSILYHAGSQLDRR